MSSACVGSRIKEIKDDEQFKKELALTKNKLVAVNFFASWCDRCKILAPRLDDLSVKYRQANFFKANVELCINSKRLYDVHATPTIVFFYNSKKLDSLVGPDSIGAVDAAVVKHLTALPRNLHSSDDDYSPPLVIPGQDDLSPLIDLTSSECLNYSDGNGLENALTHGKACLVSDCDDQLIISLGFQQPVKIHSLQLVCPQDGRAPRTVKLYVNQVHTMDFATAVRTRPVQEFNLTPVDVNEDSVLGLAYIKFQRVQRLTIFVQNNQRNCETSAIRNIRLYGTLLSGSTDMRDFKRVSGDKGERH